MDRWRASTIPGSGGTPVESTTVRLPERTNFPRVFTNTRARRLRMRSRTIKLNLSKHAEAAIVCCAF